MKNITDPSYHFDSYPLIYSLCFLYRENDILMLLRKKPPNAGLWNGVGGHIEQGESAHSGCLREVQEETGYCLNKLKFRGVLTWQSYEVPDGGLYIFSARAPEYEPIQTEEGTLTWKKRDWVFSSDEVVKNIHYFGPYVFEDHLPCIHHFSYEQGEIQSYQRFQLPEALVWNRAVNV
ncbi:MAG: 8-oxo-dGTP diphosphatase [Anaerolineaceae bacterium]|nr:8-oxo-dGTP diphosphatase [Anaerolineaceae bacterium]